jgi:hypothetical protein
MHKVERSIWTESKTHTSTVTSKEYKDTLLVNTIAEAYDLSHALVRRQELDILWSLKALLKK